MEILNFKTGNIDTANKKLAWRFLKDSHIQNLLMYHTKLNQILDEYLFYMFGMSVRYSDVPKNFKTYSDRMVDKIKSEQSDFFGKLKRGLHEYCSDHLVCFGRLVCEAKVSDANIVEMIKFYDKMLEIVDKAIGKKYTYGYIFSDDDGIAINNMAENMRAIFCCPQDTVTIFVPKKLFDKRAHKKNKNIYFKGKIRYNHYKKYIVIHYYNCKNEFNWMNLWQIKSHNNGPLQYFLESSSLTDNEMTIFFDN